MTYDSVYDILRGLHIIMMIAWMASLMMLPRLFLYHTETAPPGSVFDANFLGWEGKILKIILVPGMVLTLLFGLALIWVDVHRRSAGWGFLAEPWMVVKLAGVVFLVGWTTYLIWAYGGLAAGRRDRSAEFWRKTNELPFLAAIAMVIAVTVEFGRR